ncbi:MAG: hypothetical protein GXY19_01640 [Phycisphaerae bacterium]|mgnify:FL=1|nr:hypothetical protein [Phycisphaerae bacterium]
MKRETIERLAMDRALGELNEDAATLFETYLAEHAEARQWAEPMTQTCIRTRQAIAQKTQPSSAQLAPPKPFRVDWSALARWAAVIAVAAILGAAIGRRSAPSPTPEPETVIVRTVPRQAGAEGWRRVLGETEEGFWQTKAVAMLQSQPREVQRSTESGPSLWDRYRQFRKERSREKVY